MPAPTTCKAYEKASVACRVFAQRADSTYAYYKRYNKARYNAKPAA